jgi:spoIIIJ-associated protein
MSTKLEFMAKNVKKAVELASAELNLPKDGLKYEVISYGSSGIFGLSRTKEAKIRVKLPEDMLTPEEKPESVVDDNVKTDDISPSNDTSALDKNKKNTDLANTPSSQELFSFPDDPAEMGRHVLQRIVDTITSDAKISVVKDEDRLLFNVNGGDAGMLIGKRGQTLDAIQTIVNKVINKHDQNRIRVLVDIEGYLETRRENLEKMALRMAEKSKKIGKPMTLGPMNAYDRRIVHLALKDFAEVQTRSRGDGPLRKLLILPKKRNAARR